MLNKFLKVILLLSIVYLGVPNILAQKTVMSNNGLNILYSGVVNEIDILSEGIKRKNLKVYCKEFAIIDSNEHYYIAIPRTSTIKTVYIKVKDKSKKIWTDSILFRIKKVPLPTAQLGTLTPNNSYNFREIAMQQYLYAFIEQFHFDGIKYTILKYNLHATNFNNLSLLNIQNNDNTTKPIRTFLAFNRGYNKIFIDSIVAILHSKNGHIKDTVYLKPIVYYTKVDNSSKLFMEFIHDDKVYYISNIDEFEKYSGQKGESILKQIKDEDTFTIARRVDSANTLVQFQRYFESKESKVKLSIRKITDSSYYIKYFNEEGNCIAEGKSLNFNFDVEKNLPFKSSFSNQIDSLFYFIYFQNIIPFGEWKFYHSEGKLLTIGNFKAIDKRKQIEKASMEPYILCGSEFMETFKMIGIWKLFDINGKLIEIIEKEKD